MTHAAAQTMSPAERRRAKLVIGAGLVVLAVGFNALVVPPLADLARSWLYTPCQGVLLESSVVDRGAGNRHAYRVNCEYDYEFGGLTRRGDVFRQGMPFATRAGAESALDRVKRIDPLTVYVDAGRPERAVLSRGPTAFEIVFGTVAVVVNGLVVGLVGVVVVRRVCGR